MGKIMKELCYYCEEKESVKVFNDLPFCKECYDWIINLKSDKDETKKINIKSLLGSE